MATPRRPRRRSQRAAHVVTLDLVNQRLAADADGAARLALAEPARTAG